VRGNIVGCGDSLRDEVTSTSQTVGVSNARDINGARKASQISKVDLCLSTKNRFKVRYGTWNVGTLTGRFRKLAEVLRRFSGKVIK